MTRLRESVVFGHPMSLATMASSQYDFATRMKIVVSMTALTPLVHDLEAVRTPPHVETPVVSRYLKMGVVSFQALLFNHLPPGSSHPPPPEIQD